MRFLVISFMHLYNGMVKKGNQDFIKSVFSIFLFFAFMDFSYDKCCYKVKLF